MRSTTHPWSRPERRGSNRCTWLAILLLVATGLALTSCKKDSDGFGSLEVYAVDGFGNPESGVTVTPSGDLGMSATDASGRAAWEKAPAGDYTASATKGARRGRATFSIRKGHLTTVGITL